MLHLTHCCIYVLEMNLIFVYILIKYKAQNTEVQVLAPNLTPERSLVTCYISLTERRT